MAFEGHDEVLATIVEPPELITLVETPADVERLSFSPGDKLAYLTQTTLSVGNRSRIVD